MKKYKITQEQINDIKELDKITIQGIVYVFDNEYQLIKHDDAYFIQDNKGKKLIFGNELVTWFDDLEELFEIVNSTDMTNSELEAKLEREEANKDTQNKTDFSFLDLSLLEETAEIFKFGAEKYGKWNYRKGHNYTKIYSAILRHLTAWIWLREDYDKETNKHHLSHVIANCMMLLHTIKHCSKDFDDRS